VTPSRCNFYFTKHHHHQVKEVKEETLMEKVLKSQRDAVAAIGRNYGNRPASYKGIYL
jgi:hypothetical protein